MKWLAVSGGAVMVSHYLSACSKAVEGSWEEHTTNPSQTEKQQQLSGTSDPASTTGQSMGSETDVPPSHTPQPDETNGTATVAFVRTTDRAGGIRKAIELLGVNPVDGKKIFLKPNFNSADPTPGSTHPDTLRALVTHLKEMGSTHITLGDRSGMGDTRQVMEAIGVFGLAAELNFDAIVFDELGADDWVMVDPPKSHWEGGFPLARPCLEADVLVQTCCLKTHRYGGHFTMSLKNSVGMVGKRIPGNLHNFMNELHQSRFQREMIAEINAVYTPALIILDGVEAFISGGPAVGEKVVSEVVLAGTDRVAMDAVGVALLRYHGCRTEAADGPIFQQDQIARAVELDLGVDSPEKINLVTGDSSSSAYADQIMDILLSG